MTKLTDKQFKQLQKKLFEYIDGMNTDQLKYDLKRYMLEDYLTQPTWKLVSDKLIEFDLMKEEEMEVAQMFNRSDLNALLVTVLIILAAFAFGVIQIKN